MVQVLVKIQIVSKIIFFKFTRFSHDDLTNNGLIKFFRLNENFLIRKYKKYKKIKYENQFNEYITKKYNFINSIVNTCCYQPFLNNNYMMGYILCNSYPTQNNC